MRRTAGGGLTGAAEGVPGTSRPGARRPPTPAADAVHGGTPRALGRTGPSRSPSCGHPAQHRTPAPHAPAAPVLPRGRVGGAVPDAAGPDRPPPGAPAGPRPSRHGPAPVRSPPRRRRPARAGPRSGGSPAPTVVPTPGPRARGRAAARALPTTGTARSATRGPPSQGPADVRLSRNESARRTDPAVHRRRPLGGRLSLRPPGALPNITRVSARHPLPSRRPGPRDPAVRSRKEVGARLPTRPAMRR